MSKRPRRFLKESLPQSAIDNSKVGSDNNDDSIDDDAYVWSEDDWWSHRRRRRPYPSSSQMILKLKSSASATETAAVVGNKKKNDLPPILISFLASIGKLQQLPGSDSGNEGEGKNGEDTSRNARVDALDDPSRSTLATGQHQRYKTLLSLGSGQLWKPPQKKEFRKLNELVKAEQKAYCQALGEFWLEHKEKVLIGFTSPQSLSSTEVPAAAKFVELAAYPTYIQVPWQKEFQGKSYGKCCQVISLETVAGISAGNKGRWTVDAIESQDLGTGPGKSQQQQEKHILAALPAIGSSVPIPTRKQTVDFLKYDKQAILLAKDHKVPVITTLETLEAIMAIHNSHWSLPVYFQDNLAIVELPLPQPDYSPRVCLTRGLNEGLSQWVDHQFQPEVREETSKERTLSFRYILLALPPSSGVMVGPTDSRAQNTSKQTKVLVRVPNQYTRIHAHVEYFPERGEEIQSSYERSLWILDHFLKFDRSLVARIDPSSFCRVLKWEPTSIAHALAGNEGSVSAVSSGMSSSSPLTSQDPMDHWHRLAKLLQAIPLISRNDSEFLVCLPGRDKHQLPRSASVHMKQANDAEGVVASGDISVEAELNRAGQVQLGPNAIQCTKNNWKWTSDRVPFTFPPADFAKDDSQESSMKHRSSKSQI